MKNFLLTLVLLVLIPITIEAYDFSEENDEGVTIYYNKVSSTDLTCEVTYRSTSYNTYSGSVAIPETVTNSSNGNIYKVIGIGSSAFRNSSTSSANLTGVMIPTTVTYIGDHAFYYSAKLTSLSIPDSVTSIGSYAFYYCKGLIGELVIPNSVTSIESNAFRNCDGLTGELKIPNSVTSIGISAFEYCSGITKLTIEDGEETLSFATNTSDNPFTSCPIETLYLGRDVGYTGICSPFSDNTSLKILTLGNNVTTINSYEFSGCTNLPSVTIPNGVTSIDNHAFYCTGIKTLTIEDGSEPLAMTTTGVNATPFTDCPIETLYVGRDISYGNYSPFRNNTSLKILTLGNNVTTINSYEFSGCTNLPSVTIPDGVTSIENSAFGGCSSLAILFIEDGEETLSMTTSSSATPFTNSPIETLYLGRNISYNGNYSPFRNNTSLKILTLGNNVTTINSYEFYGCTNLPSVTIPNGVTSIGSSAFYGCTNLLSITIPNCVTSIGGSAFKLCTSLSQLTIPSSVSSIGDSAFYGCTNLSSLTIPNGVSSIGDSAFYNCTGLSQLTIPSSVSSIGNSAFYGCIGIKTLSMEDGNETLAMTTSSSYTPFTNCPIETLYLGRDISYTDNYSPFRDNTYLTSLTIGDKVTIINDYEFYWCKGLAELILPNSVTSIGSYAFYYCSGLSGELCIPNSVTSIGSYAFYYCSGLSGELSIPNSVTSIGSYAFYCCKGLENLSIGNGVMIINDYTFHYCLGLTELVIPNSVTQIDEAAFSGCSSLKKLTLEDGEETLSMTTSSSSTPFSNCPIETLYLGREISYNGNYSPFRSNTSLKYLTIGSNVTTIGAYAFYGCSGLSGELVIPNSVTSIGNFAFSGCSGLSGELIIPNSVTYIGDYAFNYCSGLTSVTIGNGVTSIENLAFKDCLGLTELTLEDGEETLSMTTTSYATPFTNCPIETLYLGRDISYNGNYSPFRDNTDLTSLTIGGKVTSIRSYKFYGCSGLRELTIPNNVTSIGNYAFEDCLGLTELTLEDGEETLSLTTSSSATPFTNCPIETLYLGRDISYNSDYSPFRKNALLKYLTIGNKVTTISKDEFYDCSGLSGELVIPNSVTSIGNGAFSGCSGLTALTLEDGTNFLSLDSWSFPECIETFYLGRNLEDSGGFGYNSPLSSLTIGAYVTVIPDGEFSSCKYLIDITSLNTTPPTIYSSTFRYVESVKAPKEALLDYATADYWYYIRKIYAEEKGKTYYPVPIIYEGDAIITADGGGMNGIVAQEDDVVQITPLSGSKVSGMVVYRADDITEDINKNGSSSLEVTEFHLTNRVYTYGFDAEHYFDITVPSAGQLLEELTVYNVPMVYGLKVTGDVNGTDIMTIRKMPYIRQLDLSDATIVSGGDPYYDYYETSYNVIGKYFFIDMPNLKYVNLPKGTTTIEDYAFSDLTGLTGISIPGNVTSIGEYAFSGCSNIASLSLEDGSETLTFSNANKNSLADCPLVSLYLGRDLKYSYTSSNNTYYKSPFNNQQMLTALTISNSVTNIGEDEFYGCTGLIEVTIPESVTSIGNTAFANCTHLSKINFDAIACESAGTSSYPIFDGCTNLTDVTIGDAVTIIPAYLFYKCSTLIGELILPNSVTSIENHAFAYCDGLTSIEIPNSVTTIRNSTFYSCSGLTSVTIGNGVTSIENYAFEYCDGLTSVEIPNSVTTIGKYAFAYCRGLTSIGIPNSVITIGDGAFYNCSNLTRATTGDMVETIGEVVFSSCSSLARITIGESVETISSSAFSGCAQLSTINSKNPTPPDITSNTFDDVDKATCVLNVPIGSINAYWIHLYWGLFFHINEVDFGYEELKEDIEDTQDLLEDVWDTISTDYYDVANDYRNDYENLKKQLEELLAVLEIAYSNGNLTDEKIAEIKQELEEIKQKIEELLAIAKEAYKILDIDYVPSDVVDNDVQIYTLSGARVNTPTKGHVYIFRYSDGTTKKIFIK